MLRWLGTWLFGHDVFVSYARADGSGYAGAVRGGNQITGAVERHLPPR